MYRGGDFDGLPKDWSCPPCGVGKNRFKVYVEGTAYDQMAAEKKANKAAMASKKAGGPSKRELLMRAPSLEPPGRLSDSRVTM